MQFGFNNRLVRERGYTSSNRLNEQLVHHQRAYVCVFLSGWISEVVYEYTHACRKCVVSVCVVWRVPHEPFQLLCPAILDGKR